MTTPLPTRSTRPIVPNLASSSAAAQPAYHHEFRPVTPRVGSAGAIGTPNSATTSMQQQSQQQQYPSSGASAAAGPSTLNIVGSASDPFEKDKRGPISATLADARAFVHQMESLKGARPASLTEVSRPFTPRMARRNSPYNPTSSPSPPAAVGGALSYPSNDPFPSPPDSPARFSSRPSLTNPGLANTPQQQQQPHRQHSGSSLSRDDDDEDEDDAPMHRHALSASHSKQLKSKRSFSRSDDPSFADIDARPDSAVSSSGGSSRPSSSNVVAGSSTASARSRSASTASPSTFARRSPMHIGGGGGGGGSSGAIVPELVFPSGGTDEDWRMVEQQPGEDTSRPGTAASGALPLSRQTSGLRVGSGAVAITPQPQQSSSQQQQQALSMSPSPPQQPRPPSGSPGQVLRPRSRPNSSSSSATTDSLGAASSSSNVSTGASIATATTSSSSSSSKPSSAVGGSRPNSSSSSSSQQPARTSPQLPADSSAQISVGIKSFESKANDGVAAAVPAASARPSSALFARPLDVSSASIIGDSASASSASVASSAGQPVAAPVPVLDLAALRALHSNMQKSAVVDKPDLMRELLTATYRSLSHASKHFASISPQEVTGLIGFALSLPMVGGGNSGSSSSGGGGGGGGESSASKLHTLASKLVFEVSREPGNDPHLHAILPTIIASILVKPTTVSPSAGGSGGSGGGTERALKSLSYALGALHNLTVESSTTTSTAASASSSPLCSQPLIDALSNLLREEVYQRALRIESEEEQAKLCMEVTGVLRNIATIGGSHKLFCTPINFAVSAGNQASSSPAAPQLSSLDILCHLTMRLSHHAALLLNLTRILSKLSLHQSCRAIMYAPTPLPAASSAASSAATASPAPPTQGFLPSLVNALQLHHVKLSLCIRVLYILGNLTMQNDDCRRAIVDCVCRPANAAAAAAVAATGKGDSARSSTSAAAASSETAVAAAGVDPSPSKQRPQSKDAQPTDAFDSPSSSDGGGGGEMAVAAGWEVLLSLLARSYQRDSKLRKLLATASATSVAAASASSVSAAASASASLKKHGAMSHENEELLVKLIRLLANLSINPSIGARFVNDRRISALMKILKYKSVESQEELVLNTVSAITNLSFYLKPNGGGNAGTNVGGSRPTSAKDAAAAADQLQSSSQQQQQQQSLLFFTPPRDVLGLLLGYLFSPNLELLSETLRALGNFSRDLRFRQLMSRASSRTEDAVVLLLDHPEVSVVYGATGIVLNIAAHTTEQAILFEERGQVCHKLVEIMERYGGSTPPREQQETDEDGQPIATAAEAEDADDEEEEESEPEWGLLAMVLKTFLNLRVAAPSSSDDASASAAAAASASRPLSPSASLTLKRELDLDVRMHLMHALEQILARCEVETERIHEQLDEDALREGADSASLQQLLRAVREVDTLAQQLLPACLMPAAWQQQE